MDVFFPPGLEELAGAVSLPGRFLTPFPCRLLSACGTRSIDSSFSRQLIGIKTFFQDHQEARTSSAPRKTGFLRSRLGKAKPSLMVAATAPASSLLKKL
jgi:hypothetical protein